MTKNYKILTSYIKDVSSKIAGTENYIYLKENIPKYLNKDESFEFDGAIKQLDESQQSTVIVFILAISAI